MGRYTVCAAQQLIGADQQTTDPQPMVLKRYRYGYDAARNRIREQIDDDVRSATYDELNRLMAIQPGGMIAVAGKVNEPAAVTVQGQPVTVSGANRFEGTAVVAPGTTTIAVGAVDANGNARLNQYEVDAAGTSQTRTYDANGNVTSDGVRTFEWDARDRVVAVETGTSRSELTYDGLGRRVRIVEKNGGVTIADRRFVWCEAQLCQERDATNAILKEYGSFGVTIGGNAYFYTRDHLGSIHELVDGVGAVRARYAYDPYGRVTQISGDVQSDLRYTGHFYHEPSGLSLAPYRALDSSVGRWLSDDPVGMEDGPNLYAYVNGNPTGATDSLGLLKWDVSTREAAAKQIKRIKQAEMKTKNKRGLTPRGLTDPYFNVNCKEGACTGCNEKGWRLNMIVTYRLRAIWIATDADKPEARIIEHEMAHVDDDLKILADLRPEAEAMEQKTYKTRYQCEQDCIRWGMKFVQSASWRRTGWDMWDDFKNTFFWWLE